MAHSVLFTFNQLQGISRIIADKDKTDSGRIDGAHGDLHALRPQLFDCGMCIIYPQTKMFDAVDSEVRRRIGPIFRQGFGPFTLEQLYIAGRP
jgi:hypothetical protein